MTSAPDPGLRSLFDKIARDRGFSCEAYKEGCLRRRIAVRMRIRGAHDYPAYAELLDRDPEEYDRLLDALTINVTKFFRNREMWDRLTADVLPLLWGRRGGTLSCWSAGCASGEEAYTLAILLTEQARRTGRMLGPVQIDATDYDRASLARAAEAAYRAAAFDEMPGDLLAHYFSSDEPRRLVPEIRQLVRFRHHDLLRERPPAPPYDLIMCRNVVIYFDRATQERLFGNFVDALRAGGYLVLGKVETLFGDARRRLELVDARERIYRLP